MEENGNVSRIKAYDGECTEKTEENKLHEKFKYLFLSDTGTKK